MSPSMCLLPSTEEVLLERARRLTNNRYADSFLFMGNDSKDNKIILFCVRRKHLVENYIFLQLSSGKIYSTTGTNFTENNDWQSQTVKLECSYPMKTWRILYNGLIKVADSPTLSHIKLNFLWHSISSPIYFNKKGSPSFYLNSDSHLDDQFICNLYQGYEQWGMLHGTIQINQSDVQEFNMKALRKRSWTFHKRNSMTFVLFAENGLLASVNSSINYCKGHFRTLRRHCCMVDCDVQYPFNRDAKISFQFSGGKLWYNVVTNIARRHTLEFENIEILTSSSRVNGENAKGLILFQNRFKKYESVSRNYIFPQVTHSSPLIVNLRDNECLDTVLVGGKASSLAKIHYSLSSCYFTEESMKNIFLPEGFCVTANAMNLCVKENSDLLHMLNLLKYSLQEIPGSQLKVFCNKLKVIWKNTKLNEKLVSKICVYVKRNCWYAVRSSGILEDSLNFSAAGHHSSYLNVLGTENVIGAIKKCWASAYSFEAVEYRRNNGLPLTTQLGVTVQEMVKYTVNGVLFTCHPVHKDPRIITLTFQSSMEKENTVLIDKNNFTTVKNPLEHIDCSHLKKENSDQEESHYSVETIPRLCKISVELEKLFSYPVDVEWAIANNNIYILQCRPITTVFTWTDFEVCHELDTGYTEYDAITFYNCGEIMTDVTSPLSITFNCEIMEKAYKFADKEPDVIYHKQLLAVYQFRVAMNICNGILLQVNRDIPFFQKVLDVIVCGQVITTEELYALAQQRNGTTNLLTSANRMASMLKSLMVNHNNTKKCVNLAENFKINVEDSHSAQLLLERINKSVTVLKEVAEYHLNVTNVNNILKAIVLCMMAKDDEENLQYHITNLSLYLLNYDHTVSANIPKMLSEIARLICISGKKDDYLSVPLRYKQEWLEHNCILAFQRLNNFFEKYGFRSVKEADLITETWVLKSDPIFECLDALILSLKVDDEPDHQSNTENNTENITQRYGRRIKWLALLCKKAVINRELTKQSLMLVLHQFRMAFRKLATVMVEEALIPNEKLIFYFTFYEVHQMVHEKNRTQILHKAQRRQRLWSYLRNFKFDDVIVGLPSPKKTPIPNEEVRLYKGTSISCHSVKGRVCVLQSINEVKEIIPGDILITRSIDIGWSPYFPLLSGLVTEIGGLMSHGAIIARECGLPCVVGVTNITSCFQTGDMVEISGNTGTIIKVKEVFAEKAKNFIEDTTQFSSKKSSEKSHLDSRNNM